MCDLRSLALRALAALFLWVCLPLAASAENHSGHPGLGGEPHAVALHEALVSVGPGVDPYGYYAASIYATDPATGNSTVLGQAPYPLGYTVNFPAYDRQRGILYCLG